MGLFNKNKKMCPICGNPVSWFLPIKWNDQPLCDDCGMKLTELSGDIRTRVEGSMESIQEYFAAFERNRALRSSFQPTCKREFGIFFGGCIQLDVPKRLLRLSDSDNAFVYEPEDIVSFRIMEDDAPLFECTQDQFVCYESAAPRQVQNLGPELEDFQMEWRRCEQMRRMEDQLERQAEARGVHYSPEYIPFPDIRDFNPFREYHIYVEVENPYKRESKDFKEDGPGFSDSNPTVAGYMRAYENSWREMRILAESVMAVMNPDAPVVNIPLPVSENADAGAGAQSRSMPVSDPVEELQRYKALLDSGVITEEDFIAKKRQLLGI